MTLLKQTTTTGAADDSFSKLDACDIEEDCSANSLTGDSLLHGMRTLNIAQPPKPSNQETSDIFDTSFEATKSGSTQDSGMASAQSQYYGICGESLRAGNVTGASDVHADDRECLECRDADREQVCWEELCEEYPDKDGDTVLHLAVLQAVKHLVDVVRLLRLQGQINLRNRLFQTPLHLAVLTSQHSAVEPLLGLGASLSAQDCHGNTPLHAACERNDGDMLRALLGDHEGSGGDPDMAVVVGGHDENSCEDDAVQNGSTDIVGLLLERGADINAKDGKSGRSAIHFAVENSQPSHHRVLMQLLEHPSLRINTATFAHQTALQLARGRHRLDLVHLLHEHGAEWSDSLGDCSSDSLSEEDAMEDEVHVLYDDICVAGQPAAYTRFVRTGQLPSEQIPPEQLRTGQFSPDISNPGNFHPENSHAENSHTDNFPPNDYHPVIFHPDNSHPDNFHPENSHAENSHTDNFPPNDYHPVIFHPDNSHPDNFHPDNTHTDNSNTDNFHPERLSPGNQSSSRTTPRIRKIFTRTTSTQEQKCLKLQPERTESEQSTAAFVCITY
ncbi:hypothetical protein BaRGS_00034004 [Batillaria attramentaria]|uniref:Uncharacterized protein n=1 Tax=Batillaria attramentaria TaxID=370345 RepID=A0ABD0JID6_9CAEN